MKKIKLLIVDDEPLAHKLLEGYCASIGYVEVVGNCYDSISVINFLSKNQVDAMLLDIQMPDLTGLELLESMHKNLPKVIFTTAHAKYALEGFYYDEVIDYLHKPIRLTRFIKALERLRKQLEIEAAVIPETTGGAIKKVDYITLKDNKIVYKIRLSEIVYIQSWGNYIKVFLTDNSTRVARKTMGEIEKMLFELEFDRIHKSYIVHRKKVKALEGNQVLMNTGVTLPIGKSYMMLAKERLIK